MKRILPLLLILSLALSCCAFSAFAEEAPYPEAALCYTQSETVFPQSHLKNWYYDIEEQYGTDIWHFKPADPQLRYYIICTPEVIDPVTGEVSTGGYDSTFTRHLPIDTSHLIKRSGNLRTGGLYLTDDPDLATYALILDFDYAHDVGKFTYADGSKVKTFNPSLVATLLNLTDGTSITSEVLTTRAVSVGESVRKSMLADAKGKRFYGNSPMVSSSDFPGYWDFLRLERPGTILRALGDETLLAACRPPKAGEILQNGSSGETALGLQRLLIAFGESISPDGSIGSGTITALKRVQASYGLEETDTLDAEGYNQLLAILLIVRNPEAAGKLLPRLLGSEEYEALSARVQAVKT